MRSLRARLIIGFSLVAVVPIALAILLLSRRVESMVQADAAERLDAAVGGLRVDLMTQHRQIGAKLGIAARDPALKRLYLLRGSSLRDLRDHLAEQRFLLGLDFLEIVDPAGAPVVVVPEGPFESAAGVRLSSTAPIIYDARAVGTLRGGVLLDVAFLNRLKERTGLGLVLRDSTGRLAASTMTGAHPAAVGRAGTKRVEMMGRSYLGRSYALDLGSGPPITITGLVPTTALDRAITDLRWAAALLALAGLTIAVLLGIVWSLQVSRPVERLAAYSGRLARGEWDEPLQLHSVLELETLVQALDRMRRDLILYRERLVTTERQAAWSQMARKVAHEVKNPLTPIAISVADLKRSYEQRRTDFPEILDQAVRTVTLEVDSLKRLLQEFSDFARFPAPRFAPVLLGDLLDDLRGLYPREVEQGTLTLVAPEQNAGLRADRGQIRQALVNLIKNGLEALHGQPQGRVTLRADASDSELVLTISDTGPGMTPEQRANLFTPGFTTKATGSGLGLTIVQRIVSDHGGTVAVEACDGGGTTFRMRLPRHEEAACPPS